MDVRKQREAEFHDKEFADRARESTDKYYSIWGSTYKVYEDTLTSKCRGRRVLEYGCGPGSHSFFLAQHGAQVNGIDISPVAIDQARAEAERRGLRNAEYRVMDAEALSFPPASFQLICGSGILHHLNLERAYAEIARTLAADGTAVFIEPMGHNPVVNLYRRLTPHMRTVDEHPLRQADFKLAARYFNKVETHFFHFTTLLAVALRRLPGFRATLHILERFDRFLFRFVPQAWRLSWVVILILEQPKPVAGGA